jgi:hypothetical protein
VADSKSSLFSFVLSAGGGGGGGGAGAGTGGADTLESILLVYIREIKKKENMEECLNSFSNIRCFF